MDFRLRDLVVKSFGEWRSLLGACHKNAFDATAQEVPEFASDLVGLWEGQDG